MKPFKLFLFLYFGIHRAYAMDFETFYQQVHIQSLEKNYIRFRGRKLLSYESYHLMNTEQKEQLYGSLVLVFTKISRFITFNEQSGIGIATQLGSYLQFDIKYYETLEDIGIQGEIKAICVLPYFDKCILLGYQTF
ncbi:hypothetical protein [Helicobacter apodemus]|nr:hypothetical protein [Helicobacter apodemus]